jgi:cobalt-zinc-cadmium efflux system membrane fusion protein
MLVMNMFRDSARRFAGAAFLCVTASFMMTGCGEAPKPEAVPAAKIEGESVVFPKGSVQLAALVMEVAVERPASPVRLNGRLSWNEDRTVRVYTPFAGRVATILVQPGDAVKQGQTLAVIASPDFGQAQAETRRAQGDFAFARQNLARVKDLHENGVVAAKDLNAAEAEFARSESEIRRAEARLKLYGGGSEIDQTYGLKSPLTGVVVEKNINPGQELRPDQMASNAPALFVITNPSSLWVLLDAAEKDLANLAVGSSLTIKVPTYPNDEFTARIASIADFLDPVTRTIKVRAVVDNTARRLKGEMFINAEAKSRRGSVVMVPAQAVMFLGGRYFLFVEEAEGRFSRREVVTGDAEGGLVTIESGVAAGQKVVAEGALLLQQILQPRRVVK